ncbi:solute carrier family 39 (zinc transporter), member 1/2/3 [Sarotherodon galilaeus]
MTPPKLVFYLTCLFLVEFAQVNNQEFFSSGHQERRFISLKTGDSVTLHCYSKDGVTPRFYWYKQTLAEKPRLISTFYVYEQNATFHSEFKSDPRFTLDTETGQNHLIISDVRISDSATYYCICSYLHTSTFSESITVGVKDSDLNIKAVVQQSASETIQPRGSVTLNCTVYTGACDGEHSIYWFKDSEESHPGLIYTHGVRNDQCERNANERTNTCVSNLTITSLNVSHAGTYYCAVASCGHILFGGGTTLDFKGKLQYSKQINEVKSLVLVYVLSGALTFTSTLVVLLAFLLYKMSKRNHFKSGHQQARLSTPSPEGSHDADNLHYAALSINLPNRSKRQRKYQNECVYSSVKQ